jgi:hypothetical protein
MRNVDRMRVIPVRPKMLAVVLTLVMFGALIGLSGALANSTSKAVIHACVGKSNGAVRFIASHKKCQKSEKSVLVDQKGQIGPHGPAGPHGATGPQGITGPAGPADSEVVDGPQITLSYGTDPTGSTAISTASCNSSLNGANREAYGGGVQVTPHPTSINADLISIASSYPGEGVTGTTEATPAAAGQAADAWTGVAQVNRLETGDTVTVQTYVVCGP